MTNEEFVAYANAKCEELKQLRSSYIQLSAAINGKKNRQHLAAESGI